MIRTPKREVAISNEYDFVVTFGTSLSRESLGAAEVFAAPLEAAKNADSSFHEQVTSVQVNGTRLVYSPVGPPSSSQNGELMFHKAALNGVKTAMTGGARRLLVVLPRVFEPVTEFQVDFAVALGAVEAIYPFRAVHRLVTDWRPMLVLARLGFANFNGDNQRLRILVETRSRRLRVRYAFNRRQVRTESLRRSSSLRAIMFIAAQISTTTVSKTPVAASFLKPCSRRSQFGVSPVELRIPESTHNIIFQHNEFYNAAPSQASDP